MDIGTAVAIFLVLSLILLTLFCLLTKYFHHKLAQNIQEAAEIYSMVDEMGNNNDEDLEGNYEEFKEQQQMKNLKVQNRKKPGFEEIEMAVLKVPLNQNDDIYSSNILRKRLNNEMPALNMENIKMETNRSISSLKQFKPEKLVTTNRSHRDADDTKRSFDRSARGLDQDDLTRHTFINKLVCYDSQGITVVEVNVNSIRKLGQGAVKQSKTVRTWCISTNETNFDGQLQIFGFSKNEFACYKYSTKVEVNSMKLNEDYAIKSLKTCEVKQAIEIQQYLRIKMQLEMNL